MLVKNIKKPGDYDFSWPRTTDKVENLTGFEDLKFDRLTVWYKHDSQKYLVAAQVHLNNHG